MTYKEQLQKIVNDYRAAGQPWPATSKDIAAWALDNGRWHAQRDTLLNRCADELSDAMREEFYTDPQGRRVRTKHAAKRVVDGEQMVLWDDIRTAPYEHMLVAFQQRRQQIVGDCHHLKNDRLLARRVGHTTPHYLGSELAEKHATVAEFATHYRNYPGSKEWKEASMFAVKAICVDFTTRPNPNARDCAGAQSPACAGAHFPSKTAVRLLDTGPTEGDHASLGI